MSFSGIFFFLEKNDNYNFYNYTTTTTKWSTFKEIFVIYWKIKKKKFNTEYFGKFSRNKQEKNSGSFFSFCYGQLYHVKWVNNDERFWCSIGTTNNKKTKIIAFIWWWHFHKLYRFFSSSSSSFSIHETSKNILVYKSHKSNVMIVCIRTCTQITIIFFLFSPINFFITILYC